MGRKTAVDLKPYIGFPGGPRDAEEAAQLAHREALEAKEDHLGARESDSNEVTTTEGCFCSYCRFYRGEGGIRFIMCQQKWLALPGSARSEIAESCAD